MDKMVKSIQVVVVVVVRIHHKVMAVPVVPVLFFSKRILQHHV